MSAKNLHRPGDGTRRRPRRWPRFRAAWTWVFACAAPFVARALSIEPDYTDIAIPPNVAPLNFRVRGAARPKAKATAQDGATLVANVSADGLVRWPEAEWRAFLAAHKGRDCVLEVASEDGAVLRATNRVDATPIDAALTYRLIAPGYTYYGEMGVYQRNLTSFRERPLYRNVQLDTHQCVNCHTPNRGDPETFLFHARRFLGGTQIASKKWGDRKVDFSRTGLANAATYPAWHPSGDFIAFSANDTVQYFYRADPDKIEVVDNRSDLLLYSLADDTTQIVECDDETFETFPTWSPDGRLLYTARARTPFKAVAGETDDGRKRRVRGGMKTLYYDLVVRTFDPATRTFSAPETVIDAQASKRSVSLPRVSADGRWIVVTVGPYGNFHIWHRSADLWLVDTGTNTIRPLTELNSPETESYHAFSRDGAWMVFSSRRGDGVYTRPYFTRFDAARGVFTKPFLLPVEDPKEHETRMLSYNIPEFVTREIAAMPRDYRRLVERTPVIPTRWSPAASTKCRTPRD